MAWLYPQGSNKMLRPQTAGAVNSIQSRAGTTGAGATAGVGARGFHLPNMPRIRSLPGSLLAAQARQRGVGLAKPNPLSDKANWSTGGRQTAPAAMTGFGGMGLLTLGGVALILLFAMKKK